MRRFSPAFGPVSAIVLVALASCAAGCSGPRIVPEAAPPVAVPAPAPPPVVAPPRPVLTGDWRDWPITPGTWVYRQDGRGSVAVFGEVGADAQLVLRCDPASRKIYLSRRGLPPANGAVTLTIRTSSMLRPITMAPVGGGEPYVAAAIEPGDPLLDAIGFSRGRFIVEGGTLPTLVVPAWPEVLRVTEDCRG